jgi:hypothetical protein
MENKAEDGHGIFGLRLSHQPVEPRTLPDLSEDAATSDAF